MKTRTLLCIAGARPNFMKVAPLFQALREDSCFDPRLVHTGQHYDESLSGSFFRDLNLPPPDHWLGAGSGSHARQTADIMIRFENVIAAERPDGVVVVGDVNSTLAAAIVSVKMGVPVFHVEAGLRSFDRQMPEEINRIVTDSISDLLLITETSARTNLLREGIDGARIRFVGNLMIDSLRKHLEIARRSDILRRLGVAPKSYGVVTLHRAANVDGSGRFREMLSALTTISADLPLIFPVHPRTRNQLNGSGLRSGAITMIEPLGYLEFLCLLSNSAAVLTDSGGIQEETTALGIPCLTLRDNTERPVTVEQGTNVIAGTSRRAILTAWSNSRNQTKEGRIPALWDGKAAERCVHEFRDYFASSPTAFDGGVPAYSVGMNGAAGVSCSESSRMSQ